MPQSAAGCRVGQHRAFSCDNLQNCQGFKDNVEGASEYRKLNKEARDTPYLNMCHLELVALDHPMVVA